MLRVSTRLDDDGAGVASAEAPAFAAASGAAPGRPLTIEKRPVTAAKKPGDPLADRNVAAVLLPWLTDELRFHSVLDLACGNGEAVRQLEDAGYESWGIDLQPVSRHPRILVGDAFAVPQDDGYFDLVICAELLQSVDDHRVPALLAEIDRLSNSYVVLCTPSLEGQSCGGRIRSAAWWLDRIADFRWRVRLLREDAETGRLILMAEKPNSLASQVLPLIEQGLLDPKPRVESTTATESAPRATSPASNVTPARTEPTAEERQVARRVRGLLDEALSLFEAGHGDAAYLRISDMAKAMGPIGPRLIGLDPALGRLIEAMQARRNDEVVRILRVDIAPAFAELS